MLISHNQINKIIKQGEKQRCYICLCMHLNLQAAIAQRIKDGKKEVSRAIESRRKKFATTVALYIKQNLKTLTHLQHPIQKRVT